jgi:hypothetical protein
MFQIAFLIGSSFLIISIFIIHIITDSNSYLTQVQVREFTLNIAILILIGNAIFLITIGGIEEHRNLKKREKENEYKYL